MKAALIGAGRIARQHLSCVQTLEGVELVGVCDRSPATAEAAAQRSGARAWFTDHRVMLERTQPDVVHVTTPVDTHFELAADALRAGAHAFVEKPLAGSLQEVEDLVELARASGRQVFEDHNYVFSPTVRRLEQRVRSGALGELVEVDVVLALAFTAPGNPFVDPNLPHPAASAPGGAIADFLPHLASLATRFAGPARDVTADWSRREPGPLVSDEMRAEIRGERATVHLAVSAHERPEAFFVRVRGTRGRATAGLFRPLELLEREAGASSPALRARNVLLARQAAVRARAGGILAKLRGAPGSYQGMWDLIAATYAAVAAGGDPPVGHEDILATHRLVSALIDQEPRP
jgi:predicted dehydrogenase